MFYSESADRVCLVVWLRLNAIKGYASELHNSLIPIFHITFRADAFHAVNVVPE